MENSVIGDEIAQYFLVSREQLKVDDTETRSDGMESALGFHILLLGTCVAGADAHGKVERQDEIDPLFLHSVQRHEDPYVVHGRRIKLLDALLATEDGD